MGWRGELDYAIDSRAWEVLAWREEKYVAFQLGFRQETQLSHLFQTMLDRIERGEVRVATEGELIEWEHWDRGKCQ